MTDCIESRTDLTDLSKFQYLEISTSERAKSIVSTCGSDFHTAWSKLCDEFDNDTALKSELIEQIYDICPPQRNNAESLNKFVTTIEFSLDHLRCIKVDPTAWDLLLSYHLKRKLDLESLT